MAVDEDLAARVREQLGSRTRVEEKRMFGGLAFLLDGHLAVAVRADSMLARLGPGQAEEALQLPDVTPFVTRGRTMTGWVVIAGDGVEDDDQLAAWIDQAEAFVATLPRK